MLDSRTTPRHAQLINPSALTGTSVNPARSLGPALFVGGTALSQLWLFIVAPLIGGAIAALVSIYFFPEERRTAEAMAKV